MHLHHDWYLQQNPTVPAGEVLVLSSRRQLGNGIRDYLNSIAQQNARVWNAQSFYFEDALKAELASDGFALLTLLIDPEDRPSLRYWLSEHAQDCRPMVKCYVASHRYRDRPGELDIFDIDFDSHPEKALYYPTREEAEHDCKVIFRRGDVEIHTPQGLKHRLKDVEVEQRSPHEFVIFCVGPFGPSCGQGRGV